MFQSMHNFEQEVKVKHSRFQAQAAQERIVNNCVIAGQKEENSYQPEERRPWLLALGFRLTRQPK